MVLSGHRKKMVEEKKMVPAAALLVLVLAACGGSVEAEPPACPAALQTLRYSEPTPDPTGTSEATATGCVTPAGQRAALSSVWCCQ
jgi:hypothetical protein